MKRYIFSESVNITGNKYYLINRYIYMNMKGRVTMKQLKRLFLAFLCVGTIMGMTACGSSNNADDNGAAQDGNATGTADDAGSVDGTDGANGTNGTTGTGNTNDATNGNDNGNGEGVMDEIGDDVKDGADEIGDDIKDGVDNNNNRNTED